MAAARFLEVAKQFTENLRVRIPVKSLSPPYNFPIQIGDPRLRKISKNVEVKTSGRDLDGMVRLKHPDEVSNIIRQMDKVMSSDGLGLSAPQVGINQRILMFHAECLIRTDGTYEVQPTSVIRTFINPAIISMSTGEPDFSMEGCLSIPVLLGVVPRHESIVVSFLEYNSDGTVSSKVESFSGAVGYILQHEIDHLHGILFIDRIKDNHALGVISFDAINKRKYISDQEKIRRYDVLINTAQLLIVTLPVLLMIAYQLTNYDYVESDIYSKFISPDRKAELEKRKLEVLSKYSYQTK